MVYNNLALIVYNLTIKQTSLKISSVFEKYHTWFPRNLFHSILIFYFWNGKKGKIFFYIVAELSFGITKYLLFLFFWVFFLLSCCLLLSIDLSYGERRTVCWHIFLILKIICEPTLYSFFFCSLAVVVVLRLEGNAFKAIAYKKNNTERYIKINRK